MEVRQDILHFRVEAANEIGLNESPWLKTGLHNKNYLAKQIQELLQTAKPRPITAKQANLTLPESSVYSKVIELPKVPEHELTKAIPYEAAEFLPLPLEEMYLDWHIDPRSVKHKDGQAARHVFVVAAPKRIVDELQDVLTRCNLTLNGLESHAFSVSRALQSYLETDRLTIIVTIEAQRTTLTYTTIQAIKLTATVPVGLLQLKNSPKTALATIADEISEGISYCHNRLGITQPAANLVLTGSGALYEGLGIKLKQMSHLTAAIGYPPVKLPNGQPIHPRFAAVFGLALRK